MIHIIWVLILSQKIFIFLNLHPLCKNPGMVPQPPSSPPANSLKKYKMVNYFFCRVIFFPFMLWWTIIVVSSTPLGSVFIKFFPEKQLFANLPLRSQVWGTIFFFCLVWNKKFYLHHITWSFCALIFKGPYSRVCQ